jgi:hypothetical protein
LGQQRRALYRFFFSFLFLIGASLLPHIWFFGWWWCCCCCCCWVFFPVFYYFAVFCPFQLFSYYIREDICQCDIVSASQPLCVSDFTILMFFFWL